ncbi:hypothetical protein RRG51_02030 [Mycoplasmopsis cynos]|uniref:MAG1140 family protein n=1 Tax=Mycoplasmopsis cynos TaxID=171284 RepID=UPI002AFF5BCB|nr:hypothetical protein [Mycoplasmopsis cynos]WQQ16518.1 hypothetical protein RRG51_02030 [Mycoplasmopsis cynos]
MHKKLNEFFVITLLFILFLTALGTFIYILLTIRHYEYFNAIIKKESDELYVVNLDRKKVIQNNLLINLNYNQKIYNFKIEILDAYAESGIQINSPSLVEFMNENNIYSTVIFFSKPDVTYFNKVMNVLKELIT